MFIYRYRKYKIVFIDETYKKHKKKQFGKKCTPELKLLNHVKTLTATLISCGNAQ